MAHKAIRYLFSTLQKAILHKNPISPLSILNMQNTEPISISLKQGSLTDV